MTISDLNYVEVISEETAIEGGKAIADASAYASAYGRKFTFTDAYVYTDAYVGRKYSSSSSDAYATSIAV